jgi:tetratricopeptide (TPR) repeat protein
MWGNLGDALWQIPGRRDDARTRYRRAIALAERELAMTPDQADLTAQLGYYYGRVGDSSRASEYLGRALALDPENINAQYLSALNAADRGDTAAALRSLEAAVRLGYPVQLIRSAPEFAPLSANAQFRSITQPELPAASR